MRVGGRGRRAHAPKGPGAHHRTLAQNAARGHGSEPRRGCADRILRPLAMYERHFGLKAKPFSLTPDPTFLFPSRQHAMAMTMLEYGLESQAAFSLLT